MGEIGASEENFQTFEQKIRETDPRDYLKTATFQKHAREIDTNPNHPWETEPIGFTWTNDSGCEVMAATIVNKSEDQRGLLLAVKTTDNEPITAYLTGLEPSVRDFIESTVGLVARRFPVETKAVFVKDIIKAYPELRKMTQDQAAFNISMLATELLPDYPNAEVLNKEINLPRVDYGTPEPSAEQRSDLQKFLVKLSIKMPSDTFKTSLNKFVRDIPFIDQVYGRNFQFTFSDGLGWMVAARPDTKINEEYAFNHKTDKAATFPVKDLIKRKVNSIEQLKDVLSKMPVKPLPDMRFLKRGPKVAEFVDVEKVVGGLGITDWSVVSTSQGRGIENIKRISESFTNGTLDVSGHMEPIDVNEVGGYYFINRDGRHRIAALKALSVPFVPMTVSHCR